MIFVLLYVLRTEGGGEENDLPEQKTGGAARRCTAGIPPQFPEATENRREEGKRRLENSRSANSRREGDQGRRRWKLSPENEVGGLCAAGISGGRKKDRRKTETLVAAIDVDASPEARCLIAGEGRPGRRNDGEIAGNQKSAARV
jgi:hypothetical protein